MMNKITIYLQQLLSQFRDDRAVWRTIQDEMNNYRKRLADSNNAADCEKISRDLDQWLQGYVRRHPGGVRGMNIEFGSNNN